ncbi:MAG: hypothetical protein KIS88_05510 [Anaerolineales bacterium]|nr:hypothetical protein [Anaerolineales bacterium]
MQTQMYEIKCPFCNATTHAVLPTDPVQQEPTLLITCEDCGKEFGFTEELVYQPVADDKQR